VVQHCYRVETGPLKNAKAMSTEDMSVSPLDVDQIFLFVSDPAWKNQSKASRQFAQPSLLRLGEKKAKTKTTI